WNAKSVTKPLDGTYAARKPDITCCFPTPDSTSNRTWEKVVTFCEVKTRADSKQDKESFIEIAAKASCLFGGQDGCHFVSYIHILGTSIHLTIFHRSGSVSICPFDINSSPLQFLHILIGISFLDYVNIRFDTSIKWDSPNPDSKTKWIEIINKHGQHRKVWLKSVLVVSDSLLGQRTTVWEGELEVDSSPINKCVMIKDSWTDLLRKYTEGMILHILEQHGIEGVPMLVSEQQVKIPLRDPTHPNTMVNHSMHFLRSALPPNSSFQLWVLSHLISQPVGKLTLEFSSLGELLIAFLDYVVSE
ncbi:hypothetical protein V8E55_011874, partial [Tylopilus felleus]